MLSASKLSAQTVQHSYHLYRLLQACHPLLPIAVLLCKDQARVYDAQK